MSDPSVILLYNTKKFESIVRGNLHGKKYIGNMDIASIGEYIVSEKTLTLHSKTINGISKNPEWVCAGTPSLVIENNGDHMIIQNFCKATKKTHILKSEDFKFIKKCRIEGGYICDLEKYPESKINIGEIDERIKVEGFISDFKKIIKSLPDDSIIKKLFEDKFSQLNTPQGAPCETIDKILKYDIEILKNHQTMRTDNMIFNRCSRWIPPIPDSYSYEKYRNSINFTLPIGTRPKDFCFPSELVGTMKEMIRQAICFKNVDPGIKNKIIKFINLDDTMCHEIHRCKWSGEEIDIFNYSSSYSSKDNFIEICHRDPHDRFLSRNMYWGFGESNRQQGGYSEKQRVEQIVKLCKSNPEMMDLLKNNLN